MSQKDKFFKVLYGMKIANAIKNSGNQIDANVVLSILFDRRQSTENSFNESTNSLFYLCRDDFPSLQNRKILSIPSSRNNLCGYLYEVPKPKGLIIYVHGIGSLADDWYAIGQDYFVKNGYNVLAIDLTSCGRSEGNCIKSLSQSALDVKNTVKFVKNNSDLRGFPLFLFGHSWGGYGVCGALNFVEVDGVVSMSGFSSPLDEMLGIPLSYIDEGLYSMYNGKIFSKEEIVEALEQRMPEYSNLSAIDGINKAEETPIMIIQGGQDKIVSADITSIYAKRDEITNPNVVYRYYSEEDHLNIFRSEESKRYIASISGYKSELEKKYGKSRLKLPPEVEEECKTLFDKRLTSVINSEIFDEILEFYDFCLDRKKHLEK